jgi:hypothetical protein
MRGCGAELFTQPLIATTKGATGGEIEEIEVMIRTARGAVFIISVDSDASQSMMMYHTLSL